LAHTARTLGVEPSVQPDNRPVAEPETTRKPVISWDGKVTMTPADTSLAATTGDVVHSTFSAAWIR
jgi:hypothetical protein